MKKTPRLRDEAWAEYAAQAVAESAPEVLELVRVGLRLGDLTDSFARFVTYPDVEEWPAPDVAPPDLAPARAQLQDYLAHMTSLHEHLPLDSGSDSLIPKLRSLPRLMSHYDLERPDRLHGRPRPLRHVRESDSEGVDQDRRL